jgi:hypothetical protein
MARIKEGRTVNICEFKFAMGDEVKDIISGFKGIVVTRVEWFNGCIRYNVQPQRLKLEGGPDDTITFDEQSLKLVKSKKIKTERMEVIENWDIIKPKLLPAPTGGPYDDAKSSAPKTIRGK